MLWHVYSLVCARKRIKPSDQIRNKDIFYFQPYLMFALSNLPCSPHPTNLVPVWNTLQSQFLSQFVLLLLLLLFSPNPVSPFLLSLSLSTFNSTHCFLPAAEAPFQLGECLCLFLCTILYVCLCVWNQGGTRKRGRKSLIYKCILWEMV